MSKNVALLLHVDAYKSIRFHDNYDFDSEREKMTWRVGYLDMGCFITSFMNRKEAGFGSNVIIKKKAIGAPISIVVMN